ncbi:MAG: YheC/YheD family protein [Syntrophomonadaceae bacterium]|jgi:glutathione synthase/RimK-type ligase-like ATP-grasp enzyme|nr:YheC/YheD family protein [Syntrophomonadaceae bacterium]
MTLINGADTGNSSGKKTVNNSYENYENNLSGLMVGVLTANKNGKIQIPVGKKSRILKELSIHCQEKGLSLYIFGPRDVNKSKKQIRGLFYDSITKKWFYRQFPFPNVVYNRIPYRSLEKSSQVQNIITYLQGLGKVCFFNTRFFDKWELYKILQQNQNTVLYVPETALLEPDQLEDFIKRHPAVYIKPRNSSRGQGIIKAMRVSDGFKYLKADSNDKCWRNCKSPHAIIENLTNKKNFIMQTAIDLAEYKDRLFDLRAQAQKNGQGNWVMTGVGARVAAAGHIVTHIHNGGQKENFDLILEYLYHEDECSKNSVKNELKRICDLVPPVIEHGLGINLGIISLDVGLDKNGKIWLIEANSKPASFDEDHIRRVHTENLADYFIYCAENNL